MNGSQVIHVSKQAELKGPGDVLIADDQNRVWMVGKMTRSLRRLHLNEIGNAVHQLIGFKEGYFAAVERSGREHLIHFYGSVPSRFLFTHGEALGSKRCGSVSPQV